MAGETNMTSMDDEGIGDTIMTTRELCDQDLGMIELEDDRDEAEIDEVVAARLVEVAHQNRLRLVRGADLDPCHDHGLDHGSVHR